MNISVITEITVQIKGQIIQMTKEEAEQLYSGLHSALNKGGVDNRINGLDQTIATFDGVLVKNCSQNNSTSHNSPYPYDQTK
jgi:hypothetical protein